MVKNVLAVCSLLAVMALSACGGADWQKPDATSSQLHGDRADCKVKAEQADDGDVFEDCMKGRGWIED